MTDIPHTEPTEENMKMIVFMKELLYVLDRHGLVDEGEESEVPYERAAGVLITEVHDWYRTGRLDVKAESFGEYCQALQELNYEVDDRDEKYSAE